MSAEIDLMETGFRGSEGRSFWIGNLGLESTLMIMQCVCEYSYVCYNNMILLQKSLFASLETVNNTHYTNGG